MTSSTRTFDRSELILAWLNRRQYSSAHEDLRNYYNAVYVAFTKAFGIDLDLLPTKSPIPDEDGLYGLLVQVATAYEEVRSPFACYMCASREISQVYQKFGEPLEVAATAMRNLYLTMLLELVDLIWGSGLPCQVTQEELVACGHPGWNAPDPVDYW